MTLSSRELHITIQDWKESFGSMSIVGVGFLEFRSITVFRVILMFGTIIYIFGYA